VGFVPGVEQALRFLLVAGTAREAIELAATSWSGSLLLDMDVASPDGLSVIKSLRRCSQMPILALAGRINPVGAVEALDSGANDFIARPFQIEELGAHLRAARRYAPLLSWRSSLRQPDRRPDASDRVRGPKDSSLVRY